MIKKRIKIFEEETTPILENYTGNIERINAENSVDDVFIDGITNYKFILLKYHKSNYFKNLKMLSRINPLKTSSNKYIRERTIRSINSS